MDLVKDVAKVCSFVVFSIELSLFSKATIEAIHLVMNLEFDLNASVAFRIYSYIGSNEIVSLILLSVICFVFCYHDISLS